jgi:hypothetical protein
MTDKMLYAGVIKKTLVIIEIYRTRGAIAANIPFPNRLTIKRELKAHHPWVVDRKDTPVFFWNGHELIEQVEYEIKLANLQKHWQKLQAERDKKATVEDVLRFINANSNGRPDTKAGQNTSEGRESIDRCEGVTQ